VTKCENCVAGTYQDEAQSSRWNCTDCGTGEYSPAVDQKCIECGVGRYQPKSHLDTIGASVCKTDKSCGVLETHDNDGGCQINVATVVVYCVLIPLVVVVALVLLLILVWYFYKEFDDYTKEYETLLAFYKYRCCCHSGQHEEGPAVAIAGNGKDLRAVEMMNPYVANEVEATPHQEKERQISLELTSISVSNPPVHRHDRSVRGKIEMKAKKKKKAFGQNKLDSRSLDAMPQQEKELRSFLKRHNVGRCYDTLVADGITSKEDLIYVTVEDLIGLGVKKFEARKVVAAFSSQP
jgi:hypothetical protein